MEINKIKPYEKNAKKHSQKQIQQVADSIKRFGFVQPIVIDKNNEVVIGHCRLDAAKLLGLKEVPTISVENLTKEEVKALRLADNKLNESEWDMGLAIEELKGLPEEMIKITGFDRDLLIEADDRDDIIPENVPAKSKLGDLYELGKHRILCGDATKKDDVDKLMDGKKADMVFTDPPYNIGFSYNKHKDKMSFSDYSNFCKKWFELLDCERIVISPGPKNLPIWYDILKIKDIGWAVESVNEEEIFYDEAIWEKDNTRSGASCFHLRVCEPIIFYGKFNKKRNLDLFKFTRSIDNKLKLARKGIEKGKTAPVKPVALISEIITKFSEPNEIIKDIFQGNGTTLIASEKTGRICYGMELDPKYVDVVIQRYVDYTGNENIKLNGKNIIWKKTSEKNI
jgi:site-specific DNA-methyltransferase (adenine-specific)